MALLTTVGTIAGKKPCNMKKLSANETKAILGGGEMNSGNRGEGQNGNRGESNHGNRGTCTALVQYRHGDSPSFNRVSACGSPNTDDGGLVLSCSC